MSDEQLIGVLYLENNQVSGAFTPDRMEALNILLSQIAISIDNAQLYEAQQGQKRELEQAIADGRDWSITIDPSGFVEVAC